MYKKPIGGISVKTLFLILFWASMLGFFATALMAIISKFKKNGRAKYYLYGLGISVVLFFVAVANIEPAPQTPETTTAAQSTQITAEDVLEAFEKAGLAVPEPRDNTGSPPADLECEQLITTEAVSIYQLVSEEKAKQVQEEYNFGDYQSGPFIIRFNESHNPDGSVKYAPSPDEQSYINVLDDLLSK